MDLYCTFDQPERLPARDQTYSAASRAPWWLTLIGAAVWLGIGGVMAFLDAWPRELAALEPSLPYWVVRLIGAGFVVSALPGLFGVVGQRRAALRCADLRRRFPDRPELADHPWMPEGAIAPRGKGLFPQFFAAVIGSAVAAYPVYAVAVRHQRDFVLLAVLVLTAGAALWSWLAWFRAVGHAFKFGDGRVQFRRFPYKVGEPVELLWWPPTGVRQVNSGAMVLRCIRETVEGAGKHRMLVHEAIWQESWSYEQPRELPAGVPVNLRFEPPAGTPGTRLDGDAPVFWELEVELDVPGLDYLERYLVPVYSDAPRQGVP